MYFGSTKWATKIKLGEYIFIIREQFQPVGKTVIFKTKTFVDVMLINILERAIINVMQWARGYRLAVATTRCLFLYKYFAPCY